MQSNNGPDTPPDNHGDIVQWGTQLNDQGGELSVGEVQPTVGKPETLGKTPHMEPLPLDTDKGKK